MLAGECVRFGHECALVSIHDRHLAEVSESSISTGGREIVTLRLPSGLPWRDRMRSATAFRSSFDPEWISLQVVPYGFDDKGLVQNLGRHLLPIIGDCRLHTMFHELWIGANMGAPLKERAVGWLQRAMLLRLTRQLKPERVSTSNPNYISMLARHGIQAALSPIFGTIPVAPPPGSDWLFDQVRSANPAAPLVRDQMWIAGMFGALHAVWPPEPLLTSLQASAGKAKKHLVIAAIGKLGPGERLWEKMEIDHGHRMQFLRLGEQPASTVSEFLRLVDFGLATSPLQLIRKSAAAASMLDHGLPIIVNRDDVRFPGIPPDSTFHPQVIPFDSDLGTRLALVRRRQPNSSAPQVAEELLALLRSATKPSTDNFL